MCASAAVLAVSAFASPDVLALAIFVAGLVLAWGWAGMLALPAPRGTSVVLLISAIALTLSVGLDDQRPWLTWVPVALAISVLVAFLHQLLRVDGRPRIVESVSSIVFALGLLACAVLLVPLANTEAGVALVAGTVAGAAASAVTDIFGRWRPMRVWLAPLALAGGGAAAVLVASLMGQQWSTFLLAGVLAGAASHAVRSVLCGLPTMAHARPRLVMALTSLLVTGPVAYGVALVLLPQAALR